MAETKRINLPATKTRLGGRLAVCQIAGTVAGLLTTSLPGFLFQPSMQPVTGTSGGDFLAVLAGALVVNIPFYAAAVLLLHTFTRSVLAHPKRWCLGLPCLTLVVALIAFPRTKSQGLFWLTLIPLCASFAGTAFVLWQAKRPLAYICR